MPADLTALIQRQAELQRQLNEAQAAIRAEKDSAIESVRKQMAELGLTVEDLMPKGSASSRPKAKRPVKYQDDGGNTWTGIGQRPRWIQKALAAGATLDQFLVKK